MKYVFVHGLGQKADSWNDTTSLLPNPVTCPDLFLLLGDKSATYDNLYTVFSQYCDNTNEPLNLCGLSLGGVLALHYAIENPHNVRSLALIGTQYKIPKGLMKFQNVIFRLMPKSVFNKIGIQKQDFLQLSRSMLDIDFSSSVKSIACKTLILCGEKDAANKKAALHFSENISNATLHWVADAGHEVNTDNPQALATLLTDFYNSVE